MPWEHSAMLACWVLKSACLMGGSTSPRLLNRTFAAWSPFIKQRHFLFSRCSLFGRRSSRRWSCKRALPPSNKRRQSQSSRLPRRGSSTGGRKSTKRSGKYYWRVLCKKGIIMYRFHHNFSSCSESAEIGHAHSFCVKTCPCVFLLQSGRKIWTNHMWKSFPSFFHICYKRSMINNLSIINKLIIYRCSQQLCMGS